MTKSSETQSQTEQPKSPASSMRSAQQSIRAAAVFALGLNACAAVYTLSPSDFALPNVSSLAEMLPHRKASDPISDPVVAAMKDIQSAQQQHVALLQENSSSLQQNTALLQQDSTTLVFLRQSITDEQVDVKKISAQISTLIAKVELAAKCHNAGNNFIHFERARSQPDIRSAQKDCRACLGWKSSPRFSGFQASSTRLRHVK